MSLINDALKKAENMKGRGTAGPPAFPGPNKTTGENPGPSYEATMATMREPRRSGPSQGLILGLVGGFFLLACGVLGVGVYLIFFRGAAESAVAQLDTSILETPAPAVASAEVPAVAEQPAVPANATGTSTTEPPAVATAAPTVTPEAPAPATEPAPVSTVDPERRASVTASAAATGAESNPAIADWVASLDITGVRTGERSKVLVNNRVYSPGDTINYDFDLKLTDVTPTTLTFTDPNGAIYHLDL